MEQKINLIQPKIDGVVVNSVYDPTNSNSTVYVVEVPQSTTAHQATDHKFYKRHGTIDAAMCNYEIRDVMGRSKVPKIGLSFLVAHETNENGDEESTLSVLIRNDSDALARFVSGVCCIPLGFVAESVRNLDATYPFFHAVKINTLDSDFSQPIFPRSSQPVANVKLIENYRSIFRKSGGDQLIRWMIFADEAKRRLGTIEMGRICDNWEALDLPGADDVWPE